MASLRQDRLFEKDACGYTNNMSRIALITDSSNDLPPEILARKHIIVVPLLIHFGEEEFFDVYEQREAFWQRFARGETPRTASPSPATFAEAYQRALARADEAIMITLTSKHSSTYQNAVLAAEAFAGRVHVFDSWAISLGEGLLVLHAASLIEQGADVQETLAQLADARARLRLILYLDSLDAVQRGGRIALAMNVVKRMSSVLSIRVILEMRKGELTFGGAVRTPRKGMKHILQRIRGKKAERLATAHTRAPEFALQLADLAAPALSFPRRNVLVAEAGPVLGAHGGFRAFGVTFIERA